MISDHHGSDRDNDGADSVDVLNNLMTNGRPDPFGISIDSLVHLERESECARLAGRPVLDGPFGAVTGTIIRSGTTATLHGDREGRGVPAPVYAAGGSTGAAFATSTYGSGRVAYLGRQFADRRRDGPAGQRPLRRLERPGGHRRGARSQRDGCGWRAAGGGGTGLAAGQRRVRERFGAVDAQRRVRDDDPRA